MKKIMMGCVVLVLLALTMAGCSSRVTETGNACPGGNCDQQANEQPTGGGGDDYAGAPSTPDQKQSNTYTNNKYNVTITYPNGWTYKEVSTSEVTFSNTLTEVTRLDVKFTPFTLNMALEAYLRQAYPSRQYDAYNTSSLAGFVYDDPSSGPNGGDLKAYFFLKGAVFIEADAEIFATGEADLATLLNGINFN